MYAFSYQKMRQFNMLEFFKIFFLASKKKDSAVNELVNRLQKPGLKI